MRCVMTVGQRHGSRVWYTSGAWEFVGGRSNREAQQPWNPQALLPRPSQQCRLPSRAIQWCNRSRLPSTRGGGGTMRPKQPWPKRVAKQNSDGHPGRMRDTVGHVIIGAEPFSQIMEDSYL